ncbi:Transcription factor bye1 [Sparassis crispa]|uniref:Transcription factor BYE1 n=1 Tax=Sparassis crispa TaxID=139825 RepID=A0A401GW56_9APHY|nr:Transcription factor bye1 [Sparassis crispa]GBE86451.1 Transcription factor bye1 [Sparassis crispa]
MIHCSECKEWYHFRCVQLSERDAEDIELYTCPPCHDKTGLRTIMEWEGPEAFELVPEQEQTPKQPAKVASWESAEEVVHEKEEEHISESDDSGDEYVVEARAKPVGKRRVRRVSSSSESDAESVASVARAPKRLRRASEVSKSVGARTHSPSPAPSSLTKRKKSISSQPDAKRRRSESTLGEDPARKYCLTKLQELFCQIFLRYPFLQEETHSDDPSENAQPDKKQEDLTDEDKQALEGKAKQFATDLEQCMYDLYSEPDKNGKHGVAGKYKERFRMLSFNLSKPDRVSLHMRIASSHITPKELSTMSSTDLANEETQQSIRQAEQEALAHSILKKQTLPRAKITHKGIQDIEDMNGGSREVEHEREEEEEEERIERERLARLKVQAQRAASSSVPPESPIVPQTPSWGGPPQAPSHAGEPAASSALSLGRPSLNPLFVPPASEFTGPVEGELNLADLINIDEEPSHDDNAMSVDSIPTPFGETPSLSTRQDSTPTVQTPPLVSPREPAGISPFAEKSSKPDLSSRPSFDLKALWSPKSADPGPEQQAGGAAEGATHDEAHHHHMDMDILGEEADDQDFDMFLGRDEEDKAAPEVVDNSPEAFRAAFEALPRIWSGTLSMPLDSTMAQEVSVDARQMGGRTLDNPLLWQTLFPTRELRIDGRVPVEKSAQYLTQMRLNPTKELIAAAFSPVVVPGFESQGFKNLVEHLTTKGRHGLVFPWGNRPKEHSPGRELYIIPLLSTDPIPDYMELLDDLRLPKLRNANYLIGIWVLNKGKLAPPPTPQGLLPPQVAHLAIDLSQLQQSSTTVPIPNIFSQAVPPSVTTPMAQPQPQPTAATSALAAEVASLTPEEIQLMLRTLSSAIPAQPAAPPVPAVAPPPAPPAQTGMSAIPIQPWGAPAPSFPPAYSPPNTAFSAQPSPPHPSRPYPDMPYDNYPHDQQEQGYGCPSGSQYGGRGGERGYRGRGGPPPRGRGRDRQRDAGWPKSRGRGRGGPGPSSPTRERGGRWGESRWS